MFNREHSTHNDSSRCSDSPEFSVTIRSIQNAHCHSSRHFKQNQISGAFAYLALIFAPVYVGFQSGSPSHAHFAHFIVLHRHIGISNNSCHHATSNPFAFHKVHKAASETPAVHRPTIPTNSSCSYFSHYDFQVHHIRI